MSVVELCVGICITCVPATSVFLRHVLPSASTLHKKITHYIQKFSTSLPLSQSRSSHGDNSHGRHTDGMNGHYQNLGDKALPITGNEEHELGLYSTDRVKTNVVAGPFEGFHGDKIHLKVDLEQR